MAEDTRKVFAVKINAGNDRNGNPRRALTSLFPNAVELVEIPTTPGAYKTALSSRIPGGY